MIASVKTGAAVSCRPLQPASTAWYNQRRRTGAVVLCRAVAENYTESVTISDAIDVEFLGQEDDGSVKCTLSMVTTVRGTTTFSTATRLRTRLGLTVRGTMELASSPGATFAAVTDHSRAPEIFSNIAASAATPADGKVEVSQECTWKFLMFRGSFNIVLNVDEQPDTRAVDFSLVESKFMRAFQGSWNIQEMPGGGCKVEHTLQVTPLLSPPPAFAGYTSKIFIKQVTGILEDLQEAMQR